MASFLRWLSKFLSLLPLTKFLAIVHMSGGFDRPARRKTELIATAESTEIGCAFPPCAEMEGSPAQSSAVG
jgi:hypothetical protein